MDQSRFDALAKTLGREDSRRDLFRNLARTGAALVAARFGFGARSAAARHCRDYGCSCDGGTYRSCHRDLVCCPWSPGLPGGLGQCLYDYECYGPQCIGSGEACAPYCGWDSPCGDCCSGYCSDYGVCDAPRCTGPGCSCTSGTYLPCDYGLTCCPLLSDLYGGPGRCAPDGSC